MKRVAIWVVVGATLVSSAAIAADMAVKAPPAAPPPSPWDVIVTAALMSDYNFRGISQSNHKPSTAAGFEDRYNFTKDMQAYFGVSGESINFPNNAAAEIDFYGGFRPTFDKLALDVGAWYYYYPGGQCFNTAALCSAFGGGPAVFPFAVPSTVPLTALPNVVKQNVSFVEVYGKATYTVNDQFNFGGSVWYSPSVLNSGAWGVYTAGNVTYTFPSNMLPSGIGASLSGDLGYWDLGTSDAFYGVPAFPAGVPYTSYWSWDVGLSFTWKVLTLDLRYYDSNLSKAQCNVFTSAQNATFAAGNVSAQNPGGLGTNWCGADFVAKLSASIDFNTNLK